MCVSSVSVLSRNSWITCGCPMDSVNLRVQTQLISSRTRWGQWMKSVHLEIVVFLFFLGQFVAGKDKWVKVCKVSFQTRMQKSHLGAGRTLCVKQADGRGPRPRHLSWQAQHPCAAAPLLQVFGAFSAPATPGRLCGASLSHWAQNAFGSRVASCVTAVCSLSLSHAVWPHAIPTKCTFNTSPQQVSKSHLLTIMIHL